MKWYEAIEEAMNGACVRPIRWRGDADESIITSKKGVLVYGNGHEFILAKHFMNEEWEIVVKSSEKPSNRIFRNTDGGNFANPRHVNVAINAIANIIDEQEERLNDLLFISRVVAPLDKWKHALDLLLIHKKGKST